MPQTDRPGIFRTRWSRKDDGGFAITGATGLYLQPAEGHAPPFFKIREGPFGDNRSYLNTVQGDLGLSITPIVQVSEDHSQMRCVGSGFFISASGLLLTAAHVITDAAKFVGKPLKESRSSFDIESLRIGILLPTNPIMQGKGWFFLKIVWTGLLIKAADGIFPGPALDIKTSSDAAICQIAAPSNDYVFQPLPLIQRGIRAVGLQEGKSAIAIGYGAMQETVDTEIRGNVREGDLDFELYASTGKIVELFPDNATNRRSMVPGACFSASMTLPGGMSGSPVFDDEGLYVHGIVSSSTADETGLTALGYGTMIQEILNIPIAPLGGMTLLDANSDRQFGMPKISIPDA